MEGHVGAIPTRRSNRRDEVAIKASPLLLVASRSPRFQEVSRYPFDEIFTTMLDEHGTICSLRNIPFI